MVVVAALAALTVVVAVDGGGGGQRPVRGAAREPASKAATTRVEAAVSIPKGPGTARPGPSGPPPGSLPQTHTFPSAATARFRTLMGELWEGVVHDSLRAALPAFFPKSAYVRLKAIYGAAADWDSRLVGDYRLDIGAAHALLGREPWLARLVGVRAVSGYGHWIEPGVCDNAIGYYELPNARVIYREGGRLHSFGIASLISWRGVWYVVHFGAILRSADTGMVDRPMLGSGTSEYSGTC